MAKQIGGWDVDAIAQLGAALSFYDEPLYDYLCQRDSLPPSSYAELADQRNYWLEIDWLVQHFLCATGEENGELRWSSLYAIAALGDPPRRGVPPPVNIFNLSSEKRMEVTLRFLQVLDENTDEISVGLAIIGCRQFGLFEGADGVSELVRLLEKMAPTNTSLRRILVASLKDTGPPDAASMAVPLLTDLLQDSDVPTRLQAVKTLGWIGVPARSALPTLLTLLRRSVDDQQLVKAIAACLVRIDPGGEQIPTLVPKGKVRNMLIRLCWDLGTEGNELCKIIEGVKTGSRHDDEGPLPEDYDPYLDEPSWTIDKMNKQSEEHLSKASLRKHFEAEGIEPAGEYKPRDILEVCKKRQKRSVGYKKSRIGYGKIEAVIHAEHHLSAQQVIRNHMDGS